MSFVQIFKIAFASTALMAAMTSSQAQQTPLKAGSYRCYTTNSAPAGPAINARDPDWRKSQGLPPLESGQRATPPMQAPRLMIIPAFFGHIQIDGKGSYKMTGNGKTGKYGFNSATSTPTFTGDLAVMEVRGYNSSAGRFFLVYDSLAFQCSLQGAAAEQATATPAQPPAKPAPPATAVSLTGRFSGSYVCGNETEEMQLELKAATNGLIVAVLKFGKSSATNGSFTLDGNWNETEFNLTPAEWLKQPTPTYEMVGLQGALTEKGMNGKVVHRLCTTFELVREKIVEK
jgi:hypothetical protein